MSEGSQTPPTPKERTRAILRQLLGRDEKGSTRKRPPAAQSTWKPGQNVPRSDTVGGENEQRTVQLLQPSNVYSYIAVGALLFYAALTWIVIVAVTNNGPALLAWLTRSFQWHYLISGEFVGALVLAACTGALIRRFGLTDTLDAGRLLARNVGGVTLFYGGLGVLGACALVSSQRSIVDLWEAYPRADILVVAICVPYLCYAISDLMVAVRTPFNRLFEERSDAVTKVGDRLPFVSNIAKPVLRRLTGLGVSALWGASFLCASVFLTALGASAAVLNIGPAMGAGTWLFFSSIVVYLLTVAFFNESETKVDRVAVILAVLAQRLRWSLPSGHP